MKVSRLDQDHAADDRYRTLFETSADAILIIEKDRFVDCNQAAVDMLRYKDRNALLQCHPWELSPEYQPDGQRSVDKARKILANILKCRSQRFEWVHVRADGELLPVEVSMTAIPADEGYNLHIVWRDISERKRLEQELRHSQKMEAIGHLAGGIAHDFNNVLLPIVGYADLLAKALRDQPRLQKWAQEISRAGTLAESMVRKILAVSHKGEHLPVVLDIEATIEDALGMLRKLIGEDISVDFVKTGTPLPVKIGSGDIEQILLNLASNARDALPSGGMVELKLSRASNSGQQFARLEFSDNGVGMDEKTREHAFVPFFTTKELGSGTGLGLASVYELVTQFNGRVDVRSTPGKGTTIELLLPIADNDGSRPVEHDLQGAAQSGETRAVDDATILVVEDEEHILKLICELLEGAGYTVRTANNGFTALELIEKAMPDLVLTDAVMPRMSGPLMVKQMHAKGIHTPVIFMSGYTNDRLAAHDFDPESIVLIRKPFKEYELLERVRLTLAAA